MSVLDLARRQPTLFDAANAEHRRLFYTFMQTKTWKDCPYRFTVMPKDGNFQTDTVAAMANEVNLYYLAQEFPKKRKSYYAKAKRADPV